MSDDAINNAADVKPSLHVNDAGSKAYALASKPTPLPSLHAKEQTGAGSQSALLKPHNDPNQFSFSIHSSMHHRASHCMYVFHSRPGNG